MMLVPRRNDFDFLDNFFEDDFVPRKERNLMRTDIRELDDKYIVDVDLPGFEKDNIKLSLANGYLSINAKVEKKEEDKKHEKYVHRERFFGECSRSYYVGDDIEEKDINAEFKNGILKVEIPKKDDKKSNEVKQIEIK